MARRFLQLQILSPQILVPPVVTDEILKYLYNQDVALYLRLQGEPDIAKAAVVFLDAVSLHFGGHLGCGRGSREQLEADLYFSLPLVTVAETKVGHTHQSIGAGDEHRDTRYKLVGFVDLEFPVCPSTSSRNQVSLNHAVNAVPRKNILLVDDTCASCPRYKPHAGTGVVHTGVPHPVLRVVRYCSGWAPFGLVGEVVVGVAHAAPGEDEIDIVICWDCCALRLGEVGVIELNIISRLAAATWTLCVTDPSQALFWDCEEESVRL